MNIGFDAKRAFHNTTGLGNYSRTLIRGLAEFYPMHDYFLFNPKASQKFTKPDFPCVHEVLPSSFLDQLFPSLWRSNAVKKDLKKLRINLFHGLSHEIPFRIGETSIPSVVTIHDLIFERYPSQFNKIDVQIYRRKFRYACNNASCIIAISQQTKEDIVKMYGIDEKRIYVCYQSCDPVFAEPVNEDEKQLIRKKYRLPARFFLYVGSIIERKNLLNICRALNYLGDKLDIPLVVVGEGGRYKERVKSYLEVNNMTQRVIFLSEQGSIDKEVRTLAAIYQLSQALVYPSYFEGFGIPVLEALWSKTPVITSHVSCLPETAGDAALYVDPSNYEGIADAMIQIVENQFLKEDMVRKGIEHAKNFSLETCTRNLMDIYQKLI